jgi:hypothetical protein
VSALLAPGGAVEWLRLPRLHSPSIFGARLDRSAGPFTVAPARGSVPATAATCGTMVLETTWQTVDLGTDLDRLGVVEAVVWRRYRRGGCCDSRAQKRIFTW